MRKHGKFYYNYWRDDKNVRGVWRRTTLEEYKKEKPNWEVVLDLDKLAAGEKEIGFGNRSRFSTMITTALLLNCRAEALMQA